ncbi:MAG: twin-arginine translocase subunit TatC [Thiofilum sp.]|uniref:twin-arginine translocase subunit TatC n=1 Tax=Thiofilum sp. TaxID=2212733 RepID=UPI0025D4945D|nr:twin-arginine translocase subunit TatC [Thiofilum sp.]MBK8452698.1 twin-arginine translocase subunit TatC [Thiofilum sp.]
MTNPEPSSPAHLLGGFLEHLVELRDRLLRIVIVVGAVFICLTPFAQDLYNILSAPLIQHLPQGEKLIAVGVASPFLIPFKLALLVAFLVTLPYTFYQIWGFIAPGLYQHEKRLVTPLLVSSVSLFYIGIAFAYFVVIPMIARAAVAFAPSNVNPAPDIASYLDFTVAMFLAFGLSFETPVATILLIGMGVVSVETLIKARPYIIVGAFVIAMFLTPPDVVSQILMAVPIWMLFELGLVLSRVFNKHIARFKVEKDQFEQATTTQTTASEATDSSTNTVLATAGVAAATTAATTLWEDDQYLVQDANPSSAPESSANAAADEDSFKPLTDEEMEAEFARIEAEQAKLEADYDARNANPDDLDKT